MEKFRFEKLNIGYIYASIIRDFTLLNSNFSLMKPKLLILLAILVAFLFVVFYFWRCNECSFNDEFRKKTKRGYHCTGEKTIAVSTLSRHTFEDVSKSFKPGDEIVRPDSTDSIRVQFVCNQLIFVPELAGDEENTNKMRKYLRCQGFRLDHTCECSDKLELWTYNDVGDANLIEVVKDPPKDNTGQHIGGLSLNFTLEFDTLDLANRSKDPRIYDTYDIPQQPITENNPLVIIGVSDSGVDLDNNSPLVAGEYLWQEGMATSAPCIDPGKYGLSNLSPNLQPVDKNGHGTFVNGIIIGASSSKLKSKSDKTSPNIQILNVKNSDDNSFSVFNAICGLYFAAQQGVRTFNISWGFMEQKDSTQAPEIFKIFLRDFPNAVLIAGMGNNGVSLDYDGRFWPASLAENEVQVISVGALNEAGTSLASFSNYSYTPNRMTVLAPGENIISLVPKSLQNFSTDPPGRAVGSGTSYATPYVTREVARIQSQIVDFQLIKSKLTSSATNNLNGIPFVIE